MEDANGREREERGRKSMEKEKSFVLLIGGGRDRSLKFRCETLLSGSLST